MTELKNYINSDAMQELTDFRKYLIYQGITRSRTKSLEKGIHALWRALTEMDEQNLTLVKNITVNELINQYGRIYPMNKIINLKGGKNNV